MGISGFADLNARQIRKVRKAETSNAQPAFAGYGAAGAELPTPNGGQGCAAAV